jgi:hypothetical protein
MTEQFRSGFCFNDASARGATGISRERHIEHRKWHTHILFESRPKCVPRATRTSTGAAYFL